MRLSNDAEPRATIWGHASLMRPSGSLSAYGSCSCRCDAAKTNCGNSYRGPLDPVEAYEPPRLKGYDANFGLRHGLVK